MSEDREQACPKCGRPMEMYYSMWCPRCDKPKRETTTSLNMIKCLRHIEMTTGNKGYEDRVWSYLCDLGVTHNDTITGLPIDWDDLGSGSNMFTPELLADLTLFRDTFGITEKESLLFDFSW